jgi:acyl carrier protein
VTPSFEELVQVLRETFHQYTVPITESSTAADVPGWDSLNHVVLLMELEERFGVVLTPEETTKLPDVGALHRLIMARAA